jgi:tetrapyrrole methylase family protein / MazG family protein
LPEKPERFNELVAVMAKLRSKEGCPWDRKQTHRTLLPFLKEELGEFIEEVKKNNYEGMKEELGDILLQIIFHSRIAEEEKKFNIEDVIGTLTEKLKRRHPHVFGNTKVKNEKEVRENWEKIKARERKEKNK